MFCLSNCGSPSSWDVHSCVGWCVISTNVAYVCSYVLECSACVCGFLLFTLMCPGPFLRGRLPSIERSVHVWLRRSWHAKLSRQYCWYPKPILYFVNYCNTGCEVRGYVAWLCRLRCLAMLNGMLCENPCFPFIVLKYLNWFHVCHVRSWWHGLEKLNSRHWLRCWCLLKLLSPWLNGNTCSTHILYRVMCREFECLNWAPHGNCAIQPLQNIEWGTFCPIFVICC
jgi:hypothetical protein